MHEMETISRLSARSTAVDRAALMLQQAGARAALREPRRDLRSSAPTRRRAMARRHRSSAKGRVAIFLASRALGADRHQRRLRAFRRGGRRAPLPCCSIRAPALARGFSTVTVACAELHWPGALDDRMLKDAGRLEWLNSLGAAHFCVLDDGSIVDAFGVH